MAISNYTELKASIASWLRRSDLSAVAPDFITLAEAQMNRRLRVRPMVTRATASLTDAYSAAPGDFIAPIGFTLSATPPVDLEYVSPERVSELEAIEWGNSSTVPAKWTIIGGEFRLFPAPGQAYTGELTYWAKIPALSDANPTNWLLTSHPDAYLYGALLQSAPYLRADDRLGAWGELYSTAVADIERAYRVSNTTTLRVDPMLVGRARFDFARGI